MIYIVDIIMVLFIIILVQIYIRGYFIFHITKSGYSQ